MTTNGYIKFISNQKHQINEVTGDPRPSSEMTSGKIECLMRTINQSNRGRYEGGTFTQSSWEILIEPQENPIEEKRLLLLGEDETEIGKFAIQSLELLKFTNRIKIIV